MCSLPQQRDDLVHVVMHHPVQHSVDVLAGLAGSLDDLLQVVLVQPRVHLQQGNLIRLGPQGQGHLGVPGCLLHVVEVGQRSVLDEVGGAGAHIVSHKDACVNGGLCGCVHVGTVIPTVCLQDLHIDVDLGAGLELDEDGCLEGLLEVQHHLTGLAVAMGPALALACAEGGHAVLAVHQCPVMQGLAAEAMHLVQPIHHGQRLGAALLNIG